MNKTEQTIREFLTFLDYGGKNWLMTEEITNHSSNDYLRACTKEERDFIISEFIRDFGYEKEKI